MKNTKIKILTFSVAFSMMSSLGIGCYYNAKRSTVQPETTSSPIENQIAKTPEKENIYSSKESNEIQKDIPNEEPPKTTEDIPSIPEKPKENSKPSNSVPKKHNSCDKSSVVIGPIIQGENIIPSARKYSTPVKEVTQMIKNPSLTQKKTVFLTFDDGPDTTVTPQILNILKTNNVHATFFVLGSRLQGQANKNILTQTYKSGNAIANHSYSHNMKAIYPRNTLCVSTFMDEVNLTNAMLKGILGENFDCAVLRMPGGYNSREYYHDQNLGTLTEILEKKGVVSIDWNAENGDAVKGDKSVNGLLSNVKKYSQGQNVVVLLMHDISPNTVQALPKIIKYYKDSGYDFRVISN